MNKLFFLKFPEYIGEIPVHEPNEMSSSPLATEIAMSDPGEAGVNRPQNYSESNGNFEDECMMALFDEIPPT